MSWHRFQSVAFRGSKFYYHPWINTPRIYQVIENRYKEGFIAKSRFLDAAGHIRPTNWVFDDGRKLPQIYFSEDAIRDYWTNRFPEKSHHVFSFLNRDKDFYTHAQDQWVNRQVAGMKKHRLNFAQGYQWMEREFQKDLTISKLQRQHQLQQLQEQGKSTGLERKWLDNKLKDQFTKETLIQIEKNTQFQYQLIKDACQRAIEKARETNKPLKKISMINHSPEFTDQKLVLRFIRENPDFRDCFDSSWFVLEINTLDWFVKNDPEYYRQIVADFKQSEDRYERIKNNRKLWDYYEARRVEESIENIKAEIIPNHPHKFPTLLWEDNARQNRQRDQEYSQLLASVGNTKAQEWHAQSMVAKSRAKKNIENMMRDFASKIRSKQSTN